MYLKHLHKLILIGAILVINSQQLIAKGNSYIADSLKNEISKTNKNSKEYNKLLNKLNYHLINSNDSTAKRRLDEAIELSLKLKETKQVGVAYGNMGLYFQIKGKIEKAEEYYKKAYKINKKNGHLLTLAAICSNLSNIYISKGNYDEAIKYLNEGALTIEDDNSKKAIKIKSAIVVKNGGICALLGRHEKMLTSWFEARELAESIDDSLTLAVTSVNIAIAFYEIGSYKKALKYGRESIQISSNTNQKKLILGQALIELASTYSKLNNLDSTEYLLQEALIINKSIGNEILKLVCLNKLGTVYIKKGKRKKGFELLHKALTSRIEMNDNNEILLSYASLGEAHLQDKAVDSAFYYLNRGLSLAKKNGDILHISLINNMLYKTFIIDNNYPEAIKAHENFILYTDSLNMLDKSKELGFYEADFRFRKKRKEQKELMAQKDKAHQAEMEVSRLRQVLLLISSLILVFVSMLLWYYYRQRQKRNQTLQYHNRQLNQSKKIIQKNKEELDNLVQELEISNNSLQSFAQVAAHDIKSPLTTIISNAKQLEQHLGNSLEKVHESRIATINTSAYDMASLIDGLLKFSSLTSKLPDPLAIDLNNIIDKVALNLAKSIKRSNAVITKKISLDKALGHQTVLIQLFQNVIANALKFKKDDIDCNITIRSKPAEENFITVSIADNGIGISEEDAATIFEQHRKVHDSSKFEGYGLGLSTAFKIVRFYGGNIWVESQLGIGTTISFTLPCAK